MDAAFGPAVIADRHGAGVVSLAPSRVARRPRSSVVVWASLSAIVLLVAAGAAYIELTQALTAS
jgi:hypothetical protein